MILNKTFKLATKFSIILLVSSCAAIKEYVGLSDEDVERELINSTPELVLPPDFGKRATKSGIINKKDDFVDQSPLAFMPNPQTVQPRVSNFIAPNFYIPSSKTPSESTRNYFLESGINKEIAKEIVKELKNNFKKVQSSIQVPFDDT